MKKNVCCYDFYLKHVAYKMKLKRNKNIYWLIERTDSVNLLLKIHNCNLKSWYLSVNLGSEIFDVHWLDLYVEGFFVIDTKIGNIHCTIILIFDQIFNPCRMIWLVKVYLITFILKTLPKWRSSSPLLTLHHEKGL